jgi:hypothetical protein
MQKLDMQSLGLTPSGSRGESRLKALFWPSVQNETDVDYLGQQGLWLCFLTGIVTALMGLLQSGVSIIYYAIGAAFYILGGIGIRERARYAALACFTINVLTLIAVSISLHQAPGVISIVMAALLLANVRATWLAATSNFSRQAFDRDRLNATLLDKLTDQWPPKLWRTLQWLFWILFGLEILAVAISLALPLIFGFR